MAISKETKEFIENLIQHYTDEISSYKQIAEGFIPEIESISDTTFGIIVGNVYSEFMKTYQNQKKTPDLEDIQEFNKIKWFWNKGDCSSFKTFTDHFFVTVST